MEISKENSKENIIPKNINDRVKEILLELGVKPARIQEALSRQSVTKESLQNIMSDLGILTQEKMAQSVSMLYNLKYVSPDDVFKVNGSMLIKKGIDLDVYNGHVPLGFKDNKLLVAIADYSKKNEALTYWQKYNPVLLTGSNATLQRIFKQNFAKTEIAFKELFDKFVKATITNNEIDDASLMSKLFNALIRHACYQEVSDIHLFKSSVEVGVIKFRKDGVLYTFQSMPGQVYDRMLQKIMTDANIMTENLIKKPAEAIVAFDEEAKKQLGDIVSRYNFRLQMFQTPRRGRTAIIRILDKESAKRELTHLGYSGETLSKLLSYTDISDGLFLVTGPTGSGKSTTLYGMLNQIDPIERSLQTIENPIEYGHGAWYQYESSRGGNESQEYKQLLKGLLRNDPDVILVGEVRDKEVGEILIEAANTGHLVFSTLHANSTGTAIARLRQMGIDMPAMASILRGILAQRLVRVLCPHCKEVDKRSSSKRTISDCDLPVDGVIYKAVGCEVCNYTGFKGRRAIFELLHVNKKIKIMIENGKTTTQIIEEAFKKKETLWGCGLGLVVEGVTSVDEVERVTREEE